MSTLARPAQTVEVGEWQTQIIRGVSLSESDRRLAERLSDGAEGRVVVEELRDGLRIRASSWIGVVRFESLEVWIVPKLAGHNLGVIRMIEFTDGLGALRRGSTARAIDVQGTGLFDLVVTLFAEAAERVVRAGLITDYRDKEDQLPVVRGRLLADRQVLERFGQVDRLFCRFDERDQDVPENQLIAVALAACSRRVRHAGLRRRVHRLLSIFREVCDAERFDFREARERIDYHRLNEHYREPHELAWLVLDNLGIDDVYAAGRVRSFAFLLDMNRLFERFIHRYVERIVPSGSYRVRYQRADRSIIRDATTSRPYARVIPDLLVEWRDGSDARLAIDAKYKAYDERKLSPPDVYQSFLYAFAFGDRVDDTPWPAALLYPSSTGKAERVRLHLRRGHAIGAEITAVGIPIPAALEEAWHGGSGPVSEEVRAHLRLT